MVMIIIFACQRQRNGRADSRWAPCLITFYAFLCWWEGEKTTRQEGHQEKKPLTVISAMLHSTGTGTRHATLKRCSAATFKLAAALLVATHGTCCHLCLYYYTSLLLINNLPSFFIIAFLPWYLHQVLLVQNRTLIYISINPWLLIAQQ